MARRKTRNGQENLEAAKGSERYRSELVRNSMLSAAAELFAARGFDGASIGDLADALGMTRAGIYYHFPNKEKILEALIDKVVLSFNRQLTANLAALDHDPARALHAVVLRTALSLMETPVVFRALDRAAGKIPDSLRLKRDAAQRAMHMRISYIIEQGIAKGRFRPADPHVAALTIIGMCNWTLRWFTPSENMHDKQVANEIADMAMRSLLCQDAHRSRFDDIATSLQILREDTEHLDRLLKKRLKEYR